MAFRDRRPNVVKRRVRILFLVLGTALVGFNVVGIISLNSKQEIKKIDAFYPRTHLVTSLNDLTKNSYKNIDGNFVLMNDITIDGDSPLKNATLKGMIDGNGFNIYVKGNAKSSILHAIAKSGSVKNLGVYYSSEASFLNLSNDFGGLATYNEGSIENCFSFFEDVKLGSATLFGGLVAYNKGSIKHTITGLNVSENETYISQYVIGGIAAADINGQISKCYSELKSDYLIANRDAIIAREAFASLEGNFLGTKTNQTTLTSLYSVETMLPHIDRYYQGTRYVSKEEVKPELYLSDDYDLQFSSEIWDMTQEKAENLLVDYCSVKKGDN